MVTLPLGEPYATTANVLTEEEWRTIHNALAIYQCGYRQHDDRQRIQQLMDKVRDYYIAPSE
jgi:hypothetical protein